MTLEEKYDKAMDLLERVAVYIERSPDTNWWRDYFLLTGDHMICTDEGWQPGEAKASLIGEYGDDYILEEVNALGSELGSGFTEKEGNDV